MNENWAKAAPPDTSVPDTELVDVVHAIFSKPPAAPCTVVLQIADMSEFETEPGDPQLEMFVDIALRGTSYLWGEDKKFWTLSRNQFDLLQKYMNSMGVVLIVRCNDENEDPWEAAAKGKKLEYLRFSVEWLKKK